MVDTTAQQALKTAREALRAAQEAVRIAEQAAGLPPARGAETPGSQLLDEITVRKITIVEDDGRPRMIIGNSTHSTVLPMRGELREHPGRRASAGLLFINDDGTECGGLQFSGQHGPSDAPPSQTGYMTFDDFEQNEGFRLGLVQQGGVSRRFIEFIDRPPWSLVDFIDELDSATTPEDRTQIQDRYLNDQEPAASRLLLTRDDDGNAAIILRDAQGRDRMRLIVPAEGEPVVEVVDVNGTTASLIPPA